MRKGLAGACAEGKRNVSPRSELRRGGREMEDDAPDGDDDMRAEFEQPLAQPTHLGAGARGARRRRTSCSKT
jgi:hypothetical protein